MREDNTKPARLRTALSLPKAISTSISVPPECMLIMIYWKNLLLTKQPKLFVVTSSTGVHLLYEELLLHRLSDATWASVTQIGNCRFRPS